MAHSYNTQKLKRLARKGQEVQSQPRIHSQLQAILDSTLRINRPMRLERWLSG